MVDIQLKGSLALGWRDGMKQNSIDADKFSEKWHEMGISGGVNHIRTVRSDCSNVIKGLK